jgi:hypothetical protein
VPTPADKAKNLAAAICDAIARIYGHGFPVFDQAADAIGQMHEDLTVTDQVAIFRNGLVGDRVGQRRLYDAHRAMVQHPRIIAASRRQSPRAARSLTPAPGHAGNIDEGGAEDIRRGAALLQEMVIERAHSAAVAPRRQGRTLVNPPLLALRQR